MRSTSGSFLLELLFAYNRLRPCSVCTTVVHIFGVLSSPAVSHILVKGVRLAPLASCLE